MNLLLKITLTSAVIITLGAGLMFTPQGQQLASKLLVNTVDIGAIVEKEKLINLNKQIDLSLPVDVQGYAATLGDFIDNDTLILPFREDCPPCDELISKMSEQSNVRFMVLAFNNTPFPTIEKINNQSMTMATTNLMADRFYMDSMLSPVLYHVNGNGIIKEKYVGLDDETFPGIIAKFKG
ncbi:MAG: hypothetical protein HRU25_02895 [Psychrobium sp.]|nr:hypothetical protein [Psychrobium sp.]